MNASEKAANQIASRRPKSQTDTTITAMGLNSTGLVIPPESSTMIASVSQAVERKIQLLSLT
jgi:hypothetical protein